MTQNLRRLLIRADAGPRIGVGHVMRCLAIAQAWSRLGGQVDFACSLLPATIKRRIEREGFGILSLPPTADETSEANVISAWIKDHQPCWLILDGYRFDDDYQARLELRDTRLLCLDDYGHASHFRAHALLNQNVYPPRWGRTKPGSTVDRMSGSRHVLLRNELRGVERETKRIPAQAKRVLITFGGSDPTNMTSTVLAACNGFGRPNLSIDVILGACNPHVEKVRDIAKDSRHSVRLHCNVDRMQALYARSDLAISAAGSTCYELAFHGVPAIIFPIADNQQSLADSLALRDVAVVADPSSSVADLAKQLRHLIHDPTGRKALSDNGMALIDGCGADRVARRLASNQFTVRPAQMSDAEQLLQWRNDPEVRAICFCQEPIGYEAHCKWLAEKIASPTSDLFLVDDHDGTSIGQFRLEYDRVFAEATVSVNIAPAMRGRGMGTSLIERACRMALASRPDLRIVAQIKTGNLASQSAFRKAGFQQIASTCLNDQVALQFLYSDPEPTTAKPKAEPSRRMAS